MNDASGLKGAALPRWSPVLRGEARARALVQVRQLAAALKPAIAGFTDPSLMLGTAGVALFFDYLGRAGLGDHTEQVQACLELAFAAAEREALVPSLGRGLAGLGFVVDHLSGPDENQGLSEQIETTLAQYLAIDPWPLQYDLTEGLVGIGVFALQRLPRPSARTMVERVVSQLEACAERSAGLATWLTPAKFWPTENSGAGIYNLGAAHGVPTVATFLAAAARAGVARAGPLAHDALRWVAAHRSREADGRERFRDWVAHGAPVKPTGLYGWCYGDPGVAATVAAAGVCLGEKGWVEQAARWASEDARVSPGPDVRMNDACLCHGTAGLGLMYARLFQASQDEALLEQSRRWFERTLIPPTPGRGFAGYTSYQASPAGIVWDPEAGLAVGAAGVGLALLAAATDVEPRWDSTFLLSAP